MTIKSTNGKESSDLCHYDGLTRTKFFHGMLLTDEHLRAEQQYHREALKRLNRHLWGAGIACGLEVRRTHGLCIKVHPGFALDCDGNAIEVCKPITIDLAEQCRKKYPGGCAPEESPRITKYLVLRYAEVAAEPAPVLTPDDECTPPGEGTKCEASKYREGFCIEFWDRCPHPDPCRESETQAQGVAYGALAALWRMRGVGSDPEKVRTEMDYLRPECMASPPCPRCAEDGSAVALAKLEIDCAENEVEITCDCRQYVLSPVFLRWLLCTIFTGLDRVPKENAGLDPESQDLPAGQVFARAPTEAAWRMATEYALVDHPVRELQMKVARLEEQIEGWASKQAAARPKPKDGKEP